MILTCPVRGEIEVKNKGIEEIKRIELIKILLEKGYRKDEIKTEESIKLGNAGRNSIRSDVTVYEDGKLKMVAEIKKDKGDRSSAINNQLIPFMRNKKIRIGIYYDGETSALILDDDKVTEKPLSSMPKREVDAISKKIKFNHLLKIHEISTFLNKVDQLLHNNAVNKTERQNILNSILFMKYYDEKNSIEDKEYELRFTIENDFNEMSDLLQESAIFFKSKVKNLQINKFNSKSKDLIYSLVNYFQDYSIIKTGVNFIQSYFMKFGSTMLKQTHDQFYTPYEVVSFTTSLFNYDNADMIIDPAAGTGDFLTAAHEQAARKGVIFDENNIQYMDISQEALNLGVLNLTLAGVKTNKFFEKDSIKNSAYINNKFDFVFTNPPFGISTVYEGPESDLSSYDLKNVYDSAQHNQLGILFIERSLKLLKKGGICSIILPSGYMSNPTNNVLRDYLINEHRVIGVIGLPAGTFKGAGTDVKIDLVILQKGKSAHPYNIFVDESFKIGFNFNKKTLDKIYKRNEMTGALMLSEGSMVVDTDLPDIAMKFQAFANKNKLGPRMETNYETDHIEFNELSTSDFTPKNNAIKPVRFLKKNLEMLKSLEEKLTKGEAVLIGESGWEVQSTDKNLEIDKSKLYSYVPLGSAGKSFYMLNNKLRGWELPNRARQLTMEDDIFISRLEGSSHNFFIVDGKDTNDLIVTNAMFRVRIKDEIQRLSLYKYLFSNEFWLQQSLATNGAIMATMGEDEFNKIIIPLINKDEIEKTRKLVEQAKKTNILIN